MKKMEEPKKTKTPPGPFKEEQEVSLILEMATIEFAKHGYEALSMRSLALKCGMTTGAIYHHFANKEELYIEACHKKFDDIAHLIEKNARAASTPEHKLEVFVDTLFQEWHRDSTLLLLTQRDVINIVSKPQQSMAETHYRRLMDIAKAHLAEYFGAHLDPDFYFTFGSMLFGYCSLMSHDQLYSHMPREEYLAQRRAALLKHSALFLDAMRRSLNE